MWREKIDNPDEIILNMSNKRVFRLGGDSTPRISGMRKGYIPQYRETQGGPGNYDLHLEKLDENAVFADEQQIFRPLLSLGDVSDVASRRSKQMPDWVNKQRSLWPEYATDANKIFKQKEEWQMAPMGETHPTSWCDDAIRNQRFKNPQMAPIADTNQARFPSAQIRRADIILVVANFPHLLSKCGQYLLHGDFVKRCVKQCDVLRAFAAAFAEYPAVCKSSPYFIIEQKTGQAKQHQNKDGRGRNDDSWFLKAINSMAAVSALSRGISNFTPRG